jgi:catechol 2,3-dioxygenase-like lactoylglutathione lyase family enzyme
MFSHVMIGTNDIEKAKAFYDTVLYTLGIRPGRLESLQDGRLRVLYRTSSGVFALTQPIDCKPASYGNGETIGFAASSPAQADAWHDAGISAGGKPIEDPPGVRVNSAGKLYVAYLRDLDGHKICALYRMGDAS